MRLHVTQRSSLSQQNSSPPPPTKQSIKPSLTNTYLALKQHSFNSSYPFTTINEDEELVFKAPEKKSLAEKDSMPFKIETLPTRKAAMETLSEADE